jgi:hypothetical protein
VHAAAVMSAMNGAEAGWQLGTSFNTGRCPAHVALKGIV